MCIEGKDPDTPLVSCIYTIYNQQEWVRESLQSLLAQNYAPLEIVVSDDGSTDGTREVVSRLVDDYRAAGGRHKIILNFNEMNLGIAGNYERAVSLSHGELLFTCGGDDISHPSRVSSVVREWVKGGRSATLLATAGRMIGTDGKCVREMHYEDVVGDWLIGAFAVYSRRTFDEFPRINPLYIRDLYEDGVYAPRAKLIGKCQFCDEILLDYRYGSGVSTGGTYRKRMIRGSKAVSASNLQMISDLRGCKVGLSRIKSCEGTLAHEKIVLTLLESNDFAKRILCFLKLVRGVRDWRKIIVLLILCLPRRIGDSVLSICMR